MTSIQGEAAEALERLNGDYIYFHPVKFMKEHGRHSIIGFLLSPLLIGLTDSATFESGKAKASRFAHDEELSRHIAGKEKLSDADYGWLIFHGYFADSNPEMKLYHHDAWLKNEYELTKQAQRGNTLKHQKADNRVRDLNRKVGKRRMMK